MQIDREGVIKNGIYFDPAVGVKGNSSAVQFHTKPRYAVYFGQNTIPSTVILCKTELNEINLKRKSIFLLIEPLVDPAMSLIIVCFESPDNHLVWLWIA